jgi:hypothetical protein
MQQSPDTRWNAVLEEVRRWRREAYEADRALTRQQRAAQAERLARDFGLRLEKPLDERFPGRSRSTGSRP